MIDPESGLPADQPDGGSDYGDEWAYPVATRQRALYEGLKAVAEQFGQFDHTSGPDGAHYVPQSPFAADGMVCASCLFYDGARSCEIVAGDIAPDAVCKFWIIPADLIGRQQRGRPVQLTEIRKAVPVDSQGRERLWFRMESRAVELADGTTKIGGTVNAFGQRAKVRMVRNGQPLTVLEQIAPTAFNNTLSRQDIMLLWQHDPAVPFARTGAGNLELRVVDAKQLDYTAKMPKTQAARDAAELVRLGIVNRMSFGFTVPEGGDTLEFDEAAGMYVRTIHDLRLWEVSLVTWPAYEGTTATTRAETLALADAQSHDGDTQTDGMLIGAAACLRAAPGAGTTSEHVDRAGTTDQTKAINTRLWATRLSEAGARFNAPRITWTSSRRDA